MLCGVVCRELGKEQPVIDLLAHDMWSMGVTLVFLLAAYQIFGLNIEDGPDVLKHNNDFTQLRVAIMKQAKWVRLLTSGAGVRVTC